MRRLQTVEDVKATFAKIKKADARNAMAKAMLKYGNLSDEALLWVGDNYPCVWEDC